MAPPVRIAPGEAPAEAPVEVGRRKSVVRLDAPQARELHGAARTAPSWPGLSLLMSLGLMTGCAVESAIETATEPESTSRSIRGTVEAPQKAPAKGGAEEREDSTDRVVGSVRTTREGAPRPPTPRPTAMEGPPRPPAPRHFGGIMARVSPSVPIK